MSNVPHITVCICTYRRPVMLKRLLESLGNLETGGRFTYGIVVVDNDGSQSSKALVLDVAARSIVSVSYCVEGRQNIALARNKAVENSIGDYLAFIDDDEFPTRWWLRHLFETCAQYRADGVLGPVKPHFDEKPPRWVVEGAFYERPTYPTGFVIDWQKGRTGNLLISRDIVAAETPPFRPEFLTGEDQDLFRRLIAKGHKFVWCNEAVAYETVPPVRWKRTFMVRRALLRGRIVPVHPTFGLMGVAKSVIAVPAYAAALPFALVAGQSRFMVCLVKLSDHTGRLLALVGMNPITEPYITE